MASMGRSLPWSYLASSKVHQSTIPSFAHVVTSSARDAQHDHLPSQSIKSDALCIKITQHEYEKELADCQPKLHRRLVLNKGISRIKQRIFFIETV